MFFSPLAVIAIDRAYVGLFIDKPRPESGQ